MFHAVTTKTPVISEELLKSIFDGNGVRMDRFEEMKTMFEELEAEKKFLNEHNPCLTSFNYRDRVSIYGTEEERRREYKKFEIHGLSDVLNGLLTDDLFKASVNAVLTIYKVRHMRIDEVEQSLKFIAERKKEHCDFANVWGMWLIVEYIQTGYMTVAGHGFYSKNGIDLNEVRLIGYYYSREDGLKIHPQNEVSRGLNGVLIRMYELGEDLLKFEKEYIAVCGHDFEVIKNEELCNYEHNLKVNYRSKLALHFVLRGCMGIGDAFEKVSSEFVAKCILRTRILYDWLTQLNIRAEMGNWNVETRHLMAIDSRTPEWTLIQKYDLHKL